LLRGPPNSLTGRTGGPEIDTSLKSGDRLRDARLKAEHPAPLHGRARPGDLSASLVCAISPQSHKLRLESEEVVVCGISLGYADEEAPVNKLGMRREPPEGFTRWLGFDD
jgi:nitroreductase